MAAGRAPDPSEPQINGRKCDPVSLPAEGSSQPQAKVFGDLFMVFLLSGMLFDQPDRCADAVLGADPIPQLAGARPQRGIVCLIERGGQGIRGQMRQVDWRRAGADRRDAFSPKRLVDGMRDDDAGNPGTQNGSRRPHPAVMDDRLATRKKPVVRRSIGVEQIIACSAGVLPPQPVRMMPRRPGPGEGGAHDRSRSARIQRLTMLPNVTHTGASPAARNSASSGAGW